MENTEMGGPTAEKDAPPVPDCVDCGKPLGLYYAECRTCYLHASDFSFADYFPRVTSPEGSAR